MKKLVSRLGYVALGAVLTIVAAAKYCAGDDAEAVVRVPKPSFVSRSCDTVRNLGQEPL